MRTEDALIFPGRALAGVEWRLSYVSTAMKYVPYSEASSAQRRRFRLLAITIGIVAVGLLLGWLALRVLVAVVTLD